MDYNSLNVSHIIYALKAAENPPSPLVGSDSAANIIKEKGVISNAML